MSAAGAPAAGAHRTPIQVRFADTDAQGHLNNGSFAIYAETARLAFFRDLGSAVGSLILAHLAIDFRRQVRFGEAAMRTAYLAPPALSIGLRVYVAVPLL